MSKEKKQKLKEYQKSHGFNTFSWQNIKNGTKSIDLR